MGEKLEKSVKPSMFFGAKKQLKKQSQTRAEPKRANATLNDVARDDFCMTISQQKNIAPKGEVSEQDDVTRKLAVRVSSQI